MAGRRRHHPRRERRLSFDISFLQDGSCRGLGVKLIVALLAQACSRHAPCIACCFRFLPCISFASPSGQTIQTSSRHCSRLATPRCRKKDTLRYTLEALKQSLSSVHEAHLKHSGIHRGVAIFQPLLPPQASKEKASALKSSIEASCRPFPVL